MKAGTFASAAAYNLALFAGTAFLVWHGWDPAWFIAAYVVSASVGE